MTANPLKGAVTAKPKRTQQEICDDANQRMAADPDGRRDIEWIVRDDRAMLAWRKSSLAMLQETARNRVDVMDRRGQPMSESDTYALNLELEKLGATARYRSDGSRYLLSPGSKPNGRDHEDGLDAKHESRNSAGNHG